MIDNIKSIFSSEKAMAMVNVLFLLSMLIRGRGIVLIAFFAWIAYLIYSIKRTSFKAVKIVYGLFIVIATLMIALNLYLYLVAYEVI